MTWLFQDRRMCTSIRRRRWRPWWSWKELDSKPSPVKKTRRTSLTVSACRRSNRLQRKPAQVSPTLTYMYRYIKKKMNIMKNVNIFCHSFQKEKPIYYIDSLHRVIYFKAFISWHFDDYGLQIMETQNSVSQKMRILHKINKKEYFKQKCHVHFYALNTWLGLLLHELLHQCGVAWRRSVCGTAQV